MGQGACRSRCLGWEVNVVVSDYKCLFFHTRNCPIREQMDITDEKLREETITLERKQAVRPVNDTNIEYTKEKCSQAVADWLIGRVCYLCPHREK